MAIVGCGSATDWVQAIPFVGHGCDAIGSRYHSLHEMDAWVCLRAIAFVRRGSLGRRWHPSYIRLGDDTNVQPQQKGSIL